MSCGLGGDAFALVWDGSKLHGLNASGVSPAASAVYQRGRVPFRSQFHQKEFASFMKSITSP